MALLAEILSGAYVELSKLDVRSMPVGTSITDVLLGNAFVLQVSDAVVDHVSVESVLDNPDLRWMKIVGAAFVSVQTEADLNALDVSGLTVGTLAYVVDLAAYFQLIPSGPDLIWQEVVFGGGSVSVSAPITGNGSSGSPIAIAAATDSTAGSLSAADKTKLDGMGTTVNAPLSNSGTATAPNLSVTAIPNTNLATMTTATLKGNVSGSTTTPSDLSVSQVNTMLGNVLPKAGSNLADASATINPASDAASSYTLPASTLTTNRTVTLGTSGTPITGSIVQIIRRDLTANTLAIVNGGGGGGTLFTFAASPASALGATFAFDGTNWSLLNVFYVA